MIKDKNMKKIWGILYGMLLFPFIVSIFFSVPSADDFSIANRVLQYPNPIIGALHHTIDFYYTWCGDFFTSFFQLLLNPLLYFSVDSYALGIFLIISFLSFVLVMALYFWVQAKENYGISSSNAIRGIFFIFLIIFLNSDIYPEIFYWYDGNAYCFGYVLCIVNQILTIYYFKRNNSVRTMVLLSVVGFFACVGYQQAVFAGVIYLSEWLLAEGKIREKFIGIIPLFFMIMGGCLSVFAPGNFARHDKLDSSGIYVKAAVISSFQNTINSIISMCKSPLFIVAFVLAVLLAYQYADKSRFNPVSIILMQIVSVIGITFPISLGYSSGALPNRMLFITNLTNCIFFVLFSMSIGSWLKTELSADKRSDFDKLKKEIVLACFIVLMVAELQTDQNGKLKIENNPWIVTVANIEKAAYESNYYKDTLEYIKEADANVVEVENYPETKKSGIIKELEITSDSDDWRNRGIARFFKKEAVVLLYREE